MPAIGANERSFSDSDLKQAIAVAAEVEGLSPTKAASLADRAVKILGELNEFAED
ncbi:hypothetical protein [Pseudogemmobacter faecipullorum]|uniref:Uncharacterized protein n=1 Tax=Pseudogemmobacter faecipullorum TaxID=2755041 RepID=A0ABS8CR00_9RHOB|nr:hypothetical protein [Pseudogemmobacter faecipullorum]MCB5411794.1 hypothetical protein [Pseudogemmobacter faecipullorum]